MKSAKVSGCNGKLCAYNDANKCHAMAVEVGGPDGPFCDTFVESSIKCGWGATSGLISTCKVTVCQYNAGLECVADRIQVRLNSPLPECDTFKAR